MITKSQKSKQPKRLRPQDLVVGKVYKFILRNQTTLKYDCAERIYSRDKGHDSPPYYSYEEDFEGIPFTYLNSLDCFILVEPPRNIGKRNNSSLFEKTTLKIMGVERFFLGYIHYTSGFFDFIEVTSEEDDNAYKNA